MQMQIPALTWQVVHAALKIKSHSKIPVWFTLEDAVHGPAAVYPQKITKQGAPCAKTITANKWSDTTRFDENLNRRVAIIDFRPLDIFKITTPGRSEVYKLCQLEIPEKCIVDRAV